MSTEKYDAYGEVLPDVAGGPREARPGSARLSRIGQYLFWLLVIVIVSARIIYSPVFPAFEIGSASETPRTVAR